MVGTGLHLQLGSRSDSPLVSWEVLLRKAAARLGLPEWVTSYKDYPLAWEDLILQLTKRERSRGGKVKGRAAAHIETSVRSEVARLLKAKAKRPNADKGSNGGEVLKAIDRLRDAGPLHIIDFNFDSVLMDLLKVTKGSAVGGLSKDFDGWKMARLWG